MTELVFHIQFHGPFRVGTGRARDGIDATVDPDDPLPASHLKGLMRAATRQVLGLAREDDLVGAVFGRQRDRGNSPWAWDSAQLTTGAWPDPRTRVRISVDDDAGTARADHMVAGEEIWPGAAAIATFTVSLAGPAPAAPARHEALLRLAARAVTSVGGQRRRGMGWVTIRPAIDDPVEFATDLRTVLRRGVS